MYLCMYVCFFIAEALSQTVRTTLFSKFVLVRIFGSVRAVDDTTVLFYCTIEMSCMHLRLYGIVRRQKPVCVSRSVSIR